MKREETVSCLNRLTLNLVVFLVLPTFSIISRGQNSPPDLATAKDMRARVEAIVRKAVVPLQLSDTSAQIKITSGQILFSPEDVQEVQGYGNQAVPILSTFLIGRDGRSERAAIRLLGVVGGPAILDPLVKVLEQSPRPASREEALRSLHQAPCTPAVAATIFTAAKNDPNGVVRELAAKELSFCSPSGK